MLETARGTKITSVGQPNLDLTVILKPGNTL